MANYQILHTEIKDLDFACSLFNKAIKYQKRKGYPEYRWDDREVQKKYIEQGVHYKALIGKDIAAVFNIQTTDKKIWRHMDIGKSLFLHGVLINPKHKGKRIFGDILDWTIEYAKENDKENIRLDTWYHNPVLLDYYKSFGFKNVEDFQIPNTENTPLNCRGNRVMLMEYKI